jgi:radical SAM superfamily enzyme YgiQ (UPF0313 family)
MIDRIRKVLLINPPNTMPADSVRRIGEPLGLLYLGAALEKEGYHVTVFDMACEGYDNCNVRDGYVTYGSSPYDLKRVVEERKPDVVGVSCMFTAREKDTFEACLALREIDRSIPVVLGGLHPSLFPERFIDSGFADYVVIGEGEFRLCRLLQCINEDRTPDFDGVAYRVGKVYKINPMGTRIEDLDSIPIPDRDLVDMEKYIRIGVPFAPFSYKQRVAQILATRGCPNRCNFCAAVNYWGRKIRARSVENIIREMRLLKERYNIEEIQFVDDNLTFNKGFAAQLFTEMKELDLKWCTPNGLMFNTLDADLIRLMAESGAYQLSFGIESASERVLKEIIHKAVNLKIVKRIVGEAHGYDISVHGMFVVGFPGETKEEIMETLDFPFRAGFDSVSYFVAQPLPGSELYRQCKERGYLAENFSTIDFKTANIRVPKDSPDYNMEPEELIKLVDRRTREFNVWAKMQYPERWKRKFERYLNNHPENKDIIIGRVT